MIIRFSGKPWLTRLPTTFAKIPFSYSWFLYFRGVTGIPFTNLDRMVCPPAYGVSQALSYPCFADYTSVSAWKCRIDDAAHPSHLETDSDSDPQIRTIPRYPLASFPDRAATVPENLAPHR